jgi:Zn ribbon nucleic-acid-binding protein
MVEENTPGASHARCPICDAPDAFIAPVDAREDFFVECVNCGVYHATRKAFRHFEYLRWRGEPQGLLKLDRLAAMLRTRVTDRLVRLEYDTWHRFIEPTAESHNRQTRQKV